MESTLLLASLYLGAAVLIVPLSLRLKLGSVLGYLAAGLLLAPALKAAGADVGDLQHFAEFGVVMMLFLIGLELEPQALWAMRQRLLGLGGLQVGLTTLALSALSHWALGLSWAESVTLGLLLSLSSTAIVLQSLGERHLLRGPGGRAAFAVLLAQDLAVIPMLALLPLLAPQAVVEAGSHGAEGMAFLAQVKALPGPAKTALTLAIIALIVLGGRYLSRPIFRFIHAGHLPEMSTFFSLLLVIGIAFLMMIVGLSPALGTFLAGVVLANSEFRHQLEADIKPFKGLLLGLFFMTVGAGIDLALLAAAPLQLIGLTLAVIGVKSALLWLIAAPFGLKARERALFSLSLGQAGEFGFVILGLATGLGLLAPALAQGAFLIIGLSMLLTPGLFLLYDLTARRLSSAETGPAPDAIEERGPVIIAGIGRFGQVVNRLVRGSGIGTVVLDSDPKVIETMRHFGVKGYFGDPSNPSLLEAAGLAEASLLVIAVNEPEKAVAITRYARQMRPDLHIVARARDRVHVFELYQAGANSIVRETFDSAIRAGRYVLENMGYSDYDAAQLSQAFYKFDRAGLRELAQLWVPGQPIEKNAAYIARARALNRELETALIQSLDTPPDAAPEGEAAS